LMQSTLLRQAETICNNCVTVTVALRHFTARSD